LISNEMRHLIETGSAIRKMWERGHQLKRDHGEDRVADLTLGNPVAPPPEPVLEALREIVVDPPPNLHRYTPTAGHAEVRDAVARHLRRRDILPGATRENVVMTSGAAGASNILMRAVLDPGDEVIILAPHFPDYPVHTLNHRGVPRVVPTTPDFLPDLDVIEQSINEKTRLVILNHPNNPSGRQYPVDVLRDLAALLRKKSRDNNRIIYLLSDEPYREIRFTDEPFVSPAKVYEHGLIAYSFSKSHSLPGERIGYLAINPEAEDTLELATALGLANRILGFTNAPSIWQYVIARSLEAVVDVEDLRDKRDRLMIALQEKGYDVVEPDGTFYLFPRTPGGDDDAFVRRAMDDLLLLIGGATFGMPGHFRLAFCVTDATIDLAVRLLPEAE
jgi:aspartate aminotransferase